MPDAVSARVACASVAGLIVMQQLWRRWSARAVAEQRRGGFRAAADRPQVTAALSKTLVVSSLPAKCSGGERALIGTHDGTFHCDEALACAMLKMLPRYRDAVILRTRDPKALEECDVVVDVGAVYDGARRRFDHHQRGFTDVMSELGHATKLSSAGLVYRHFGADVLAGLAASLVSSGGGKVDQEALYKRIYKSFVEHIDGIDNGVEANDGKKNYEVPTTLSSRVAALNPRWYENADPDEMNLRFLAAMELVGGEFSDAVEAATNSWWPARSLVADALDGAAAVHPSRQILVLARACPWQSHLFQLEAERAAAGDAAAVGAAKYVVFPDSKGGGWRLQAVPVEEDSFSTRRPLPEPWRGVRDEALSKLLGLEGCVFVHAGGFIGGHANREGALAMALKAIEA